MPDPGDGGGLVLDTSVWINLLATEMTQSILGALKTHCTIPSQVAAEIKRNPITGEPIVAEDLLLLGPANQISIVVLNGPELELFFDLVGAPAVDALGDQVVDAVDLLGAEARVFGRAHGGLKLQGQGARRRVAVAAVRSLTNADDTGLILQ